ncbi:MAG TPA: M56 family metallopeptidase [Pirellulales bacterium]|jgi:beta-lactamase regulating signal transducer with metallopeptidase domain|nr:M56 family metallopeptidase [Pirellulales bacterium]
MRDVIDALNNVSAAWTPLVVAIVWQSTLLAILVAVIARALRRSSPAVRYWLWQIVAIKLLAAPLWSITLAVPWPIPAVAVAPRIENQDLALAEASADHSASPQRASAASVPSRIGSLVPHSAIERSRELSWRSWLFVGWGAAVGVQFAQLLVQRRRLSRLLREARPAGDDLIATVRVVAQSLQLARSPRVLLTLENCSPFVHGAIRASLILPRALLATLSPAELRQVLLHELAHVKRRDLAWGWLAQIARMLYFFHPVAHWCYRSVRLERELACDQLAISVGGDQPGDYVQTLVRVVSHISQPPALQNAVAMLAVEGAWAGNRSTSGATPGRHERPLP